jgi:phosphatidate cytidylyltransferase
MLKRAISGIVAIGLFLVVCFGGSYLFVLAAMLAAGLALMEWTTAYRRAAHPEKGGMSVAFAINTVLAWLGVVLPLCVAYADRHIFHPRLGMALLVAVPVVPFVFMIFRAARTGIVLGKLRQCWGVVGMIYIGLLLSAFMLLHDLGPKMRVTPFGLANWGAWLLLDVAVCVWASDTFAYFCGRSLGRHKLAPTLSPNKTIEGALGGLCGALLVGAGFGYWIHLPLLHSLMVGLLAGVLGPLGDLFESALKRELGIKDFGTLMPGHGGALDRIDSLLFVVPIAYLYLIFLIR